MAQPRTEVIDVGPAQLADIASRTADQPGLWLGLVRYDPARRWYRRLVLADAYEIWLLSWLPGQRTGYHDHGGSAGAFAVALGTLREQATASGRPGQAGRTLGPGAVRSFGPAYVHDVRNDAGEPAVSIHAYAPPLTSMRRFAVTADGKLRVSAQERTW